MAVSCGLLSEVKKKRELPRRVSLVQSYRGVAVTSRSNCEFYASSLTQFEISAPERISLPSPPPPLPALNLSLIQNELSAIHRCTLKNVKYLDRLIPGDENLCFGYKYANEGGVSIPPPPYLGSCGTVTVLTRDERIATV
ncbi:hypothetical protein CDAR_32361 [Caerostris darwini]|uniref:Uncharacterized protein n=1 Tax=Caerostris darwini TaxID=1538125 RepID=A0AAV4WPX8_9ARAC|nr:hypothetical protein CDAR_32361 [Caerostris darwini]